MNVNANTTLVDPFAINVVRCTIKNFGDKGNSSLPINGGEIIQNMCEKIACFSTYSGFFGIPEFRTNFSPSDGKILLGQTDTLIRQRKLIRELIYPCFWLMAMGKA